MNKSRILFYWFLFLTFALFFGCSSEKFISKWSSNKILIDGNDNDWKNETKFYKDEDILVGVENDDKNLYVLFETTDKSKQMQIMHRGFIVWLDNAGGTSQVLGIKFPIGMKGLFYPGADMKDLEQRFSPKELEIYSKQNESWTKMGVGRAKGISTAIAFRNNKLVYEMSISLYKRKGDLYSLNPEGDKVGIGFQTGEFEIKKGSPDLPEGSEIGEGGEGDYGGGFEGEPGETGISSEGQAKQYNESNRLNFWLIATLAANP
jgi:hypothetical protein